VRSSNLKLSKEAFLRLDVANGPTLARLQQLISRFRTNGFDNERSSVAWSIANGGVGMGFEVTMFLVSSGVDWVR